MVADNHCDYVYYKCTLPLKSLGLVRIRRKNKYLMLTKASVDLIKIQLEKFTVKYHSHLK